MVDDLLTLSKGYDNVLYIDLTKKQFRVERRRRELGLPDVAAYRTYLEEHAEEWAVFDGLCPPGNNSRSVGI